MLNKSGSEGEQVKLGGAELGETCGMEKFFIMRSAYNTSVGIVLDKFCVGPIGGRFVGCELWGAAMQPRP